MDGLSIVEAARDPSVAARAALIHGGAAGSSAASERRAFGLAWSPGAALSYGDLAKVVAAAGARLARASVGPGARVALLAPNGLSTIVAIQALLMLGAVLVPVSPRLTPDEAGVLLEDAAPDLVLREHDLDALLDELDPCAAPLPTPADGSGDVGGSGDLAIIYTSGTTGRPKGAVLPRRAFIAAAAGSAANLGVRDEDRWLLCLPLCHVGGLSIVTRCLLARRAVILAPRFEPEAVLASIARDRATLLSVVPTMLLALLEADREGILTRLRAILVGGAAAPERALVECARRGIPALTTYGLTEACSQVTAQRPRDPRTREPGSGHVLDGMELRIAGAGPEGVGCIQIRGSALFRGYHRGPAEAPANAAHRSLRSPDLPVDPDGWFTTGDLGALDEHGRLHVAARRTDLIVTGGENVYPAEVEQVLEACAGVEAAVVFGVPDERWGQVVAAAVVPTRFLEREGDQGGAPSSASPCGAARPDPPALPPELVASLARVVASRLAPHKRPRRICAASALPVTSAGKLDRAGAAARFGAAVQPFPASAGA